MLQNNATWLLQNEGKEREGEKLTKNEVKDVKLPRISFISTCELVL